MKTKFTALALATVTALSFAPKPAAASDKGLALVGGFLGGLIVASAINDSAHDNYVPARSTIIVEDRGVRCEEPEPCGYWQESCVNVWVPGCWVAQRGNYGSDCRRYVNGHYERRNNRVWVASNRYERHDRRDYRDDHNRYDNRDRRDRDSGHDRRR